MEILKVFTERKHSWMLNLNYICNKTFLQTAFEILLWDVCIDKYIDAICEYRLHKNLK